MNDEELRAWVDAWARTYKIEEDDGLANLKGQGQFEPEQVKQLIVWKYPPPLSGYRKWRFERITAFFEKNSLEEVHGATRAAFAAEDRIALNHLLSLRGIGLAIGSTILMAQNPEQYTVYDIRASRSMLNLGFIGRQDQWLPYLLACRQLADATGHTLRHVDRALYMARGKVEMPIG